MRLRGGVILAVSSTLAILCAVSVVEVEVEVADEPNQPNPLTTQHNTTTVSTYLCTDQMLLLLLSSYVMTLSVRRISSIQLWKYVIAQTST